MRKHGFRLLWLSYVDVYVLFQVALIFFFFWEPCCKIAPHWQYGVTAVEISKSEKSPFLCEEDEG